MKLRLGLNILTMILLGNVSSSQSFDHLKLKEEFDLENPSQVSGYEAVSHQKLQETALCDYDDPDSSFSAKPCSDPDACWYGNGLSKILMGYLTMYETTEDKAYLYKFIYQSMCVLENRHDTQVNLTSTQVDGGPKWTRICDVQAHHDGQLLKLSDEGVLYSKEIRVLVPPFPDYVFAPDYKLMPRNKLSEFIADNGHLPKMPTQDVVAKEGMNVGELNVLLTEKVEELTLYTIEQEEKIEELEGEVEELKSIINQLIEE